MRSRRHIIEALLAICVVLSSTGCMDKNIDSKKKDIKSNKKVEIPEVIDAPYKETVTISTVMPENLGIQWRKGDSYDDNPWYRTYKERLNIQIKNDWVSNDYAAKLNLTIADGNLPDVMAATSEQYRQLIEADLVWDLTDIYDKYASERLKGYMKQEPDTYRTALSDGRLYGIPQLSYGIIDQPAQLWIRKDWKEELKLGDPETMDDILNIAREFKKKHGGYVMTENKALTCMKVLAQAWGAHPDIWIEQADGTIGYGTVQPEMKEVLKAYSTWYKEGLINPEFTITDLTKMSQEVIHGKAGINPYPQYWGYDPGVGVVVNYGKNAVFDAYAIPSATGEPVLASIQFSNYGYIVVSKKCKNPEAVMKLLNFYAYMMDEAQDKESAKFIESLFDNAYLNIPFALRVINPMTDYDQFTQVTEALEKYQKGEKVDVTVLGKNAVKYKNSVDFIERGTPEAAGDWCQQGSPKSAYRISKDMIDHRQYVKDKVWGQAPESVSKTGDTLNSLLEEGFTKIIVGEKPLEYFDTLVEEWKKAGGEETTKDVNADWN